MNILHGAGFKIQKALREAGDLYAVAIKLNNETYCVISVPTSLAVTLQEHGRLGQVILKFPQGYDSPAVEYTQWNGAQWNISKKLVVNFTGRGTGFAGFLLFDFPYAFNSPPTPDPTQALVGLYNTVTEALVYQTPDTNFQCVQADNGISILDTVNAFVGSIAGIGGASEPPFNVNVEYINLDGNGDPTGISVTFDPYPFTIRGVQVLGTFPGTVELVAL